MRRTTRLTVKAKRLASARSTKKSSSWRNVHEIRPSAPYTIVCLRKDGNIESSAVLGKEGRMHFIDPRLADGYAVIIHSPTPELRRVFYQTVRNEPETRKRLVTATLEYLKSTHSPRTENKGFEDFKELKKTDASKLRVTQAQVSMAKLAWKRGAALHTA